MQILRLLFTFCASLLFLCGSAQFNVRFVINSLPPAGTNNEIYLAGSFNNWLAVDAKMLLQKNGDKRTINVQLPKGRYQYKFTRGSWRSVEVAANGSNMENRSMEIVSDTTIETEIKEWADNFTSTKPVSTASKNVRIIDTAFFIPQLNRHRRIWIYLPETYATSKKKYPVMYMHDGQNVFDASTSFSGEWGVDETMDSLNDEKSEMIVVAIDNGGVHRMSEYTPYPFTLQGKTNSSQKITAAGNAYVDFLVETLMPFINKNYRTKKDGKNTFIAGSSMGGIISFYALMKYPKKFGGAGVFSPAFWVNPEFKNLDPQKLKKIKGKIYFFAGTQEGEAMTTDMLHVFSQMQQHSKAKMQTVIRAEGKHNEATWRKEFPLFLDYLTP